MELLHQPPVDLSAPSDLSIAFSIFCGLIFAGATFWALAQAAKGDWIGVLAIAGGLIASLLEPMLDNLGLLWFFSDNELVVIEAFSRHIPAYVVFGYGFFFGAEAYVVYRLLLAGRGRKALWSFYAFGWFLDLLLESIGHWCDLYLYYGPQPFNLYGIPLWWMFINPALAILAGAVYYAMRDSLHGWRVLVAVPLLPMCYGAVYGAVGWPIFTALNTDVSTFVIYLAATATIVMSLLLTELTIRGVERVRRAEFAESWAPVGTGAATDGAEAAATAAQRS